MSLHALPSARSLSALLALASALAVGCSSSTQADEGDAGLDVESDGGAPRGDEGLDASVGSETAFQFRPSTLYTGTDGVHDFKVPVAVYGAKAPTVKASDASLVSIAPTKLLDPKEDVGIYFMVTVKKAGTVTLIAEEGGKKTEATLTIASYTPESWVAGSQRYTVGQNPDPPCTQCHLDGKAIDHSPATMAGGTDAQVETAIRFGRKIGGSPILVQNHRWTVTDEVAKGLVAYLRSLPPRGFPAQAP